jgi:transcriptional regulator with XRE-family HTH domain
MSKECEILYKICRNNRRLTQEDASEKLGVAPRTLSDYENGHARVPDDIVDAMCDLYNAPILAWWHLKNTSKLGRRLPDVVMPLTSGDMTAQLCMAENRLTKVVEEIQELLWDGVLGNDEKPSYDKAIEVVKQINAKLLSVIVYAEGGKT